MAAAGPKGRDGPSPREFTAVRHFMMADLGLIEECGVQARHQTVPHRARKGDEMTGFIANKDDEPSGFAARTPDEMTGKPLTICHPISKRDNKDFRR